MKVYIGPHNENTQKRDIQVQIHDYDVWDGDHTLAYIILPMLKRLKHTTNPTVDDEDVPDNLKYESGESYDTDPDKHEKRWQYVIGEMIFAFEKHYDMSYYGGLEDRIENGFKLFGKYYMSLWS